jgi:hypothetical protein
MVEWEKLILAGMFLFALAYVVGVSGALAALAWAKLKEWGVVR